MKRGTAARVSCVVTLALAAALMGASGTAVLAQVPAAASLTCRASAVRLLGIEGVVANALSAPCADDTGTLLDLPAGLLAVQAVSAHTRVLPPSSGATSRAQLAGVDLALLGVRADLIESQVTVSCEAGQPRPSGTSTVMGLVVNGQAIPSSDPVDLPLLVGRLRVNHTVVVGNTITRRAVWLETAVGSIILGEAQVGFSGNPCKGGEVAGRGSITVVQDSQPKSRQRFSFTGDLGVFSLRDDGRSVGAERRTFPLASGRYRIVELQPTGGRVQRAWEPRDVSCTDPDGGTMVDLENRTVVVDLDPGENIRCTFVNVNGILAATDGDVDNPARGLDPVATKRDQPPTTGSPVVVDPPTPPTTAIPTPPPDDGNGGSRVASTGLVAVPLVALLAGVLWFLLVAARRRRADEEA